MDERGSSTPTAKVLFNVADGEGGVDVETLWAYNLGADHYRIDNLPFYAYGVSRHDVVFAPFSPEQKIPVFDRVVSKSGNRTIRVILDPPAKDHNDSEKLLVRLVEMGCGYEGANRSYVVINVPPHVRLEEVQDFLEKSEAQWECADPTFGQIHPDEPHEKS